MSSRASHVESDRVACAPDRSVPAVRPTDVLVARQPVLDARLNVAGYELLARRAPRAPT
jgi:hypothetical protein